MPAIFLFGDGTVVKYSVLAEGGKCPRFFFGDCFTFQAHHMIEAVQNNKQIEPLGATFKDGYRVAEIVDAALLSAKTGKFEKVKFRV